MLQRVQYRVQFPTTGLLFEADLALDEGVTCITGPNGSGKSLVIEMIRYCLFGKEALRGPASDYTNLEARLEFSIEGQDYVVSRTRQRETLTRDGTTIASGTSTLNEMIPRLLGFNLKVFDVACSINQGELERLTQMSPAERKRMVDSVVGMAALDGIERWCGAEATRLRREADAIEESTQKPMVPVRPEDYEESELLQDELVLAEDLYAEFVRLQGFPAPVEPVDPRVVGTVEELEEHQERRAEVISQRRVAESKVRDIPECSHTPEQVEAWRAWQAYGRESARRGPQPTLDHVAVTTMLQQWEDFTQYQRLAAAAVTCPDCGSRFTPSGDHIGETPTEPGIPLPELKEELRAHEAWAEPLPVPPTPEVTFASEAEARQVEAAIGRQQERIEAQKLLDSLPVPADRASELNALRRYNTQREAYADALSAYTSAQARLVELEGVDVRVAELRRRYTAAKVYEAQLAAYLEAEKLYEENCDRAEQRKADALAMRRAGEALRLTRTKVKQYLIPALSSASSHYLRGMTNGRRTDIVISDEFDITVDGQTIESLEGSGKAVANLAVRLALGHVLTQKMFPVLLGDELDAAMDQERAAATTETLRSLSSRIGQVILVSHKNIPADNIVQF